MMCDLVDNVSDNYYEDTPCNLFNCDDLSDNDGEATPYQGGEKREPSGRILAPLGPTHAQL